jgi:hypothetical protein
MENSAGVARSPGSRPDLDPIEWAVIGVVIAGVTLVLSIEQKIRDCRREKSKEIHEKATLGNLLRLQNINGHLASLRDLVQRTHKVGRVVVDENRTGITRSSIVFDDERSAEEFNRMFDAMMFHIGRLNRLISEIDIDGFPLNDADEKEFVQAPVEEIKLRTKAALEADLDPYLRLNETDALLSDYGQFISGIETILDVGKIRPAFA